MNVVVSQTGDRSEFTVDGNCSFSVERGSSPGTVLLSVRSPNRVASFLGPMMEISVDRSRAARTAATEATPRVNVAPVRSMSVATTLTSSTALDDAPPSYTNVIVDGGPSPREGADANRSLLSTLSPVIDQSSVEEQRFSIIVKTIAGSSGTLQVFGSMTMWKVKERCEDLTGYSAIELRLIYAGRQLEDERTLSDYGIRHGAVIHSIPRLRGS
ncbi:hypothetical protein EMPS_11139 [Entomortierella parvispora]|uniref:Ubiquitin-like domain-containing protein n=1 Tax=Entomortierella parvispora TaxID=205924 RepID=A0A9P3HL54_9FUNG|nr:hypothetical protein EMPS_11139 [Entomortierella parvispora]